MAMMPRSGMETPAGAEPGDSGEGVVTGVSRCGLKGSACPNPFPARPYPLKAIPVVNGVRLENGIYGHSRFCNTDFDDKLACLNLSGV
jgi:hypothetical protein